MGGRGGDERRRDTALWLRIDEAAAACAAAAAAVSTAKGCDREDATNELYSVLSNWRAYLACIAAESET